MKDKKKQAEAILGKSSPSIGVTSGIFKSNPVLGVKTDYLDEAISDKKIADDAIEVGKKASKMGLDTRALLNSAKKVKDSAAKGMESLPSETETFYNKTAQPGDDSYEPGKGYYNSKKKKK